MDSQNYQKDIDHKIEETIKLIIDFENSYDNIDTLGTYKEYVEEAKHKLRISKEELEKENYMLMVMGGVKSGKSSLINTLVGEKISAAKLGVETTMYPSIISPSEKNEIVIYRKRSGDTPTDNHNKKDLVSAVINDIKELSSAKEGLENFNIEKIKVELTESNILQYTANESRDIDILLVNIRTKVKEDSIIRKGVFIIDTPGIDGNKAGISGTRNENSNEYLLAEELVRRSNYLLFMQSSITPLSKDSSNLLKTMKDIQNRVIFFVHNKFSINEWRKEIEYNSENISESQKIFQSFNIKISPITIDLGMAYDAIFKDYLIKDEFTYKDLLQSSNLEILENDIYNAIKKNGKETHYSSQVSNISTMIENFKQNLEQEHSKNKIALQAKKDKISENFSNILNHLSKLSLTNKEDFFKILKNIKNNTGIKFQSNNETIFALNEAEFSTKEMTSKETLKQDEFNKIKKDISDKIIKKHNQNVDICIDIDVFNKFINYNGEENIIIKSIDAINECINSKDPINEFILRQNDLQQLKYDSNKNIEYINIAKQSWIRFGSFNVGDIEKMVESTVKAFYQNNQMDDKLLNFLYENVKEYEKDMLDKKNKLLEKIDEENKDAYNYQQAKNFLNQIENLIQKIEEVKN